MKHEIQNELDFLLSAALSKCGALADAEDLVQETVLSALTYLAHGNEIYDLRAFLRTVMNRRWNDMLRRKYKLTTVSIGEGFDLIDDMDYTENILTEDEAEAVRREVSYLAAAYRDIIVDHYFFGKSVETIAKKTSLPVGTVKSRLDFGRKQMKKGFDLMKNYEENSYKPKKLHLNNSGVCGFHEEPRSLVENDLLAQNLLLLAYEKPATTSELSRAVGVAAAFVEPIIQKLTEGELMACMGNGKFYTDFIIYDITDHYRYLKEAEELAHQHADSFCIPAKKAIDALKTKSYYSERLERYMLIHIAEAATWRACISCRKPQIFPDRPNGGRWIAFGTAGTEEDIPGNIYRGKENYSLAGCREQTVYQEKDHFLRFYNYESALYPHTKYDGMKFSTYMDAESATAQLLYALKKDLEPQSAKLDSRIIEAIPLLAEHGYLDISGEKPHVLIPCLTRTEKKDFDAICLAAITEAEKSLEKPLCEWTLTHRKEIPPHLKSVPDQKRSMPYDLSSMMFVFEAIARGIHPRDLGYPSPECILVTD